LSDLRSEYISRKYFPFSSHSSAFGTFISSEIDVSGLVVSTYKYSPNVFRRDLSPSSSSTDVLYFNHLLFTFNDSLHPSGSFVRSLGKLNLFFSSEGAEAPCVAEAPCGAPTNKRILIEYRYNR